MKSGRYIVKPKVICRNSGAVLLFYAGWFFVGPAVMKNSGTVPHACIMEVSEV